MSLPKTLPVNYIQMAIRALANEDISAADILRGTGLSVEQLQESDTVSLDQFVTAILNTRKITKNPAIGLLLGSLLHPSTHGSVGWAAINSPTLADAINIFQRYSHIRTPFVLYKPMSFGDQYIIRLTLTKNLKGAHMIFVEAMLMLLQHVIEFILGRAMSEGELYINSSAPNYAKSYAKFFHCPVYFDAHYLEIRLPIALKDTINPSADKQMFELALEQCQESAHQLQRNTNIYTDVYDYISNHLGHTLTLKYVAQAMNISSRTLIRQLKKQNTSFQTIKDEVYAFQSANYLRRSSVSINALSVIFGYQDPANFRRSFKRWFGISPRQYRDAQ
ncbi:MAG: AraC family transcriptional regulator [Piscirickettsiaceae bacterium]|nr:MAG: AraC family transcriptional regulator [Piscirickettsiaceae bacterium]